MVGSGRVAGWLTEAEDRIGWVLAHPGMSGWLKDSLRTAVDRDPVEVLNDLEMLNVLLRAKSYAHIEAGQSALTPEITGSDPFPVNLFQGSCST